MGFIHHLEVLAVAELSSKRRKQLPDSAFAIPEERKYPIHDRAHGANAISRVMQHGSADEQKRVKAAVCRRYKDLPACSGD